MIMIVWYIWNSLVTPKLRYVHGVNFVPPYIKEVCHSLSKLYFEDWRLTMDKDHVNKSCGKHWPLLNIFIFFAITSKLPPLLNFPRWLYVTNFHLIIYYNMLLPYKALVNYPTLWWTHDVTMSCTMHIWGIFNCWPCDSWVKITSITL